MIVFFNSKWFRSSCLFLLFNFWLYFWFWNLLRIFFCNINRCFHFYRLLLLYFWQYCFSLLIHSINFLCIWLHGLCSFIPFSPLFTANIRTEPTWYFYRLSHLLFIVFKRIRSVISFLTLSSLGFWRRILFKIFIQIFLETLFKMLVKLVLNW